MPEEQKPEEQEPGNEPAEETPPTEEEPKETPPAEEPPAEEKPPAEEQPPAEEEPEEIKPPEGEEVPEWVKEKISKVNAEAKNLRDRLRDAEKARDERKTSDEVDTAIATATRDLLIENVALKHKLPEAARKRLAGNTRDELEADAKELADLFGTEDEGEISLEGGLSPKGRRGSDSAEDPRSLASKHGPRAKRSR